MRTVHDLGSPIAVGRTGEIYPWNEERVIKLYFESSSRGYVRREAAVSRIVHRMGLPAPAVYDAGTEDGLWEISGRLGILFDWIDGPTMLRDLLQRPWMVVTHGKALAALHAQIHSAPGDGLPDARRRLRCVIERPMESLSARQQGEALRLLAGLPRGASVLHGDYHPDNILLQEGGPVIVDWGPAASGHPLSDVAWTFLLFTVAGSPVDASRGLRLFLRLFRQSMLRTYLRTYFELTGTSWADLEPWLGVMAVLRLADGIPEERAPLLQWIERHLGA